MSEDQQTVDPSSAKRRSWRVAGALLWVSVAIALVGVWLTQPGRDAVAQNEEPGGSSAGVIKIQTGSDGKIEVDQILQGQPAADEKPKTPMWDPNGVEDFSLKNCDGRVITKQDLLGKPWVACFVFTHCLGPCPVITRAMRDLQDRFKHEDFHLVTFTVDPDRDTPEALKLYAEVNGANLDKWYFLWGEPNDLYGLIHRSFLMPVMDPRRVPEDSKNNYQIIHSNQLLLVNAEGVVQKKFNGEKPEDLAALARELRHLLHPKSTSAAQVSEQLPAESTKPSSRDEIPADAWYMKLPAVNAGLNGLATLLLMLGYILIKQGQRTAHKNVMLATFAVSIAFLACYLVYHAALHYETGLPGKKFEGEGVIRPIYFTILITHVLLATTVPVLALTSIYRGLKADWPRHRKIAKITYPIWMYVSVTGVIIYGMLYHWPIGG